MLSHVSATGLENRVGFARISPPRCLPRESGPGREPGSGEQGAGPTPSGLTAGAERRGRMSRRPDRQREAGPGSAALQRGAAAHRGAVQGLGEGGHVCVLTHQPPASPAGPQRQPRGPGRAGAVECPPQGCAQGASPKVRRGWAAGPSPERGRPLFLRLGRKGRRLGAR